MAQFKFNDDALKNLKGKVAIVTGILSRVHADLSQEGQAELARPPLSTSLNMVQRLSMPMSILLQKNCQRMRNSSSAMSNYGQMS